MPPDAVAELAPSRVRARRLRFRAAGFLAKLIEELRYPDHMCRSCGEDMVEVTGGFWHCEACRETGAARRRRSYVGHRRLSL